MSGTKNIQGRAMTNLLFQKHHKRARSAVQRQGVSNTPALLFSLVFFTACFILMARFA